MFIGGEKLNSRLHFGAAPGRESSRSTYGQEYLQRGVSHLDELEVHQAARYGDVAVVLGRPRRRGADGRHPAAGAVLHPPGAMHGQVERQHQVGVLPGQTQGSLIFTDNISKLFHDLAWNFHGRIPQPLNKEFSD